MDTREQLLDTGMAMLLERGYNALGIQALLERTGVPKGSFYHHFPSKQAFALEAIDRYMQAVHEGLELCLTDRSRPPLERVRRFFELSEAKYRDEGYRGCLLGGLGQELSGTSAIFRDKIQSCFEGIAERIAEQLAEAQASGALAAEAEAGQLADMLIDCWEGAALRSRLLRDSAPLHRMLDFYLGPRAEAPAAAALASNSRTATTRGEQS